MTERVRAVLCDWNGLINDMEVVLRQNRYVGRKEFGLELSREDVIACWGRPIQTMYPMLFGRGGDARSWEEMERIFTRYSPRFPRRMFPEAVPVLSGLKRAHITTGLITSSPRHIVETGMREGGFPAGLFDFIHTGEDLAEYRRRKQPTLAKAVGELATRGIVPSQAVFVGDEKITMEHAAEAGMDFAVVANSIMTRERLLADGVPPERLVDRLMELPGLLGIELPGP